MGTFLGIILLGLLIFLLTKQVISIVKITKEKRAQKLKKVDDAQTNNLEKEDKK